MCRSRPGMSATKQLGAFEDTFDLDPPEFVVAGRQRRRRGEAFGLDESMDAGPQRALGDAKEAPRLHVAHRECQVRGFEQTFEQAFGQRVEQEVAHVAPLTDGAFDG